MNLNNIICKSLERLKSKGVDSSSFEIKLLLADVLGVEIGELAFYKTELTKEQSEKFEDYIIQRSTHKPIDKILGEKGFYKHVFLVNEDVLSPRADSECLVETAINILKNKNKSKILEFGVGSGCLIISILADLKNVCGIGIDISASALKIAEKNAIRIGVSDRLTLKNGSWFDEDILNPNCEKFDLIISNPPYIASEEIEGLDPEVKNFDPITALDGGKDGLRDYKQICKIASQALKHEGILIFEAGAGQAKDICNIAKNNALKHIKTVCDLNGIERCIILKK